MSMTELLLPIEIWIQVFLLLPLESILVCRRVCRTWNDIIRQPYFANLHHSASSKTIVVLDSHMGRYQFGFCNLSSSSSQNRGLGIHFTDTVIQNPKIHLSPVGSCNGLVCLSIYKCGSIIDHLLDSFPYSNDRFRLALFNPVLGSSFTLPDPPQLQGTGCSEQFGFGYLPSSSEYKVVKFFYDPSLLKSEDQRRNLVFYICTIQRRNNARPLVSRWRRRTIVDNVNVAYNGTKNVHLHKPVFMNGSLIWLTEIWPGTCKSIIYFDIENEETQTLWLPYTACGWVPHIRDRSWEVGVGVYYDDDDKAHLYFCEECTACANIWVMEDYKRIESLKLKWVILIPFRERISVKIFKVLKDGKLLISTQGQKLAWYDPVTGTLEAIQNSELTWNPFSVDTPSLLGCML